MIQTKKQKKKKKKQIINVIQVLKLVDKDFKLNIIVCKKIGIKMGKISKCMENFAKELESIKTN